MFPVEKYKYFVNGKNHVVAVSTYAGKTVKGCAKCDPRDSFDLEKGKQLAAARCAEKIAKKRQARAAMKIANAQAQLDAARAYYERMTDYFNDAQREAAQTSMEVTRIIDSL